MAHIESLLTLMEPPADVRMHAEGYLVWMAWQGELNPVVTQFMRDYGALTLESGEDQALLFFFSANAFLAAARLESWSRFDSTTLTIVIMPANLDMGGLRNFRLEMDADLRTQSLPLPETFSIWVHPDISVAATSTPGLTLAEKTPPTGLAPCKWGQMQVDTRMPYQAVLGWYAILRPLGNPLDKDFQTGWRGLFEEVEKILQRNKFRYTIHDFFLMFPLENLRQLQIWVASYLELIADLKKNNPDAYWPCVLAVINKKGVTFNNDLPAKAGLDWDQLAADHPYMSFRNALILGDSFSVHEVRFASGNGPDDWCNVSLISEEGQGGSAIPMLTPGSLALGEHPVCFYCGQRSHLLTECPTRTLPGRDKDIWRRVAGFDFATMKEGVKNLDEAVKNGGLESVPDLLPQDNIAGVMGRAIFDIGHFFQLRCISRFWRARGKGLTAGVDDLLEMDQNPIWEILDAYPETDDRGASERAIQALFSRFPRDFRLKSLLGFIALERGDPQKAAQLWNDAEGMAPAGFPQAWHIALQARVAECSGRINQAMPLYDQATRACPTWAFPAYRKIVCQVKTGFADTALLQMSSLLSQDANYFNMAILDPEMERGQIQILTGLGTIWTVLEEQMKDEAGVLSRLRKEITMWFTPDHPFAQVADERIARLQDITKYHNYVPYIAAIHGRTNLEREMQQIISRESREFRNKFKGYLEKLAYIQNEAAWFPFPRIMVEFNKNYNQCAASLNWAMQSNLHTPEAFRRALVMATDEEERIAKLEKRLKLLRLIRDVTLFFLTLAKTFFWLEVVGLLLVLVVLPLLLYYAQKTGVSWPVSTLAGQQWQVQKAATFIISFLALALAMLRTVLRFDKIRDALLEKARRADREKQRARRTAMEEKLKDRPKR
ncbi:tetratricopeptide repeat protein [Desulfovibrio sp. OttesenSCG-928-O18]|nr:tetratricopeptide repeat protein [Desulfovibrio sp. OttesenSCG-928-O18]